MFALGGKMEDQVMLTQEGYDELKARLDYLEVTKRSEVSEKIKEARELGDISENAEYDAAKEEQSMVEGEIIALKEKLAKARIINNKDSGGIVKLGKTVVILNKKFNREMEVQIVGTTEANAALNKMSDESPIGRAVLGKKEGDTVTVVAPAGEFEVVVKKVK